MSIEDIQLSDSRGTSLADSAYQALRNAILTGILSVGDSLPEEAIAQHLNMSRTPIREAMSRLRSEGLLQEVRPRGHVVSGVAAQDVFDVYAIREELDGLCYRLAASRITPHQIFVLTTIIDRMEAALDDPVRFSAMNREFHEVIIDAAGNPILARIMYDLRAVVERFPVSAYSVEGRSREALSEHRELAEALLQRNPEAAEKAVQHHLREGLRARLEALRSHERKHVKIEND